MAARDASMDFSRDIDYDSDDEAFCTFRVSCVTGRSEEEALPSLSGALFPDNTPTSAEDFNRDPADQNPPPFSPVSTPSPASVLRPPWTPPGPPVPYTLSWKVQSTGLLRMVLRDLVRKGHIKVNLSDCRRLYDLVPNLELSPKVVPIQILTLQTLATAEGAEYVLRDWAHQDGRTTVPDHLFPVVQPPDLKPWDELELWPFDSYCVAAEVVNQFLALTPQERAAPFFHKLDEAYNMVGEQRWMVDMMSMVLSFVQKASGTWPTLFRC